MNSEMDNLKIEAQLVLEILGRPKEHLLEFLKDLISKIDAEKGVSVIDKKIHEPKEAKDKKDLFTTYAEVEVKVENPLNLAILMFKYMPSHIDVISPENLKLSNNDFASILNELTRRLHGYDEITKVMQMEKQILENKLKELEKK